MTGQLGAAYDFHGTLGLCVRGSSQEQAEEGNSTASARRYLEQVSALWEDADLGQRRGLLHAILETVKIDVLAQRVSCVEPIPEFVALFRQVEDLEEQDGCFYIGENAAGC